MDNLYSEQPSHSASHNRLSIGSSPGSSATCISPFEDRDLSVCTSVTSERFPEYAQFLGNCITDTGPPSVETSSDHLSAESPTTPLKRRRGRPRKHPILVKLLNPDKPQSRSKTGCITCRRRKKKCDETKPTCLNCQKNKTPCEGYPTPEQLRQPRNKRLEKSKKSIDLPPLINGVDTETDRMLLSHFNHQLGHILSLGAVDCNPFLEILMPMAIKDTGLMHSLLCLSGCHFAKKGRTASLNASEITQRQQHHFVAAVSYLRQRGLDIAHTCAEHKETDDVSVAQMMLLCLKTAVNGETEGEYAIHMDAARHLVTCAKSHATNSVFQSFVNEFFVYHDVCNAVTSLHRRSPHLLDENMHFPQFVQPEAGSYLGVLDGIFLYLCRTTSLRDRIRERRAQGARPTVDFQTLADAQQIDDDLQNWECFHQEGTSRFWASHLYRRCAWIYLHRTICSPNENLRSAVEEGLKLLQQLPSDGEMQAILLMPVFLLGCAAFERTQRPEIRRAFDGLLSYRNSGNIRHARSVVEGVWEMMDNGDDNSWDWETLMKRMGLDFLIT